MKSFLKYFKNHGCCTHQCDTSSSPYFHLLTFKRPKLRLKVLLTYWSCPMHIDTEPRNTLFSIVFGNVTIALNQCWNAITTSSFIHEFPKYLVFHCSSLCIRLMYALNNWLCTFLNLSVAALYESLFLIFFRCFNSLLCHGGSSFRWTFIFNCFIKHRIKDANCIFNIMCFFNGRQMMIGSEKFVINNNKLIGIDF